MVLWHAQRRRKVSGSLYQMKRDKKKFELGKTPAMTKLDEKDDVRPIRARGNNQKMRALKLSYANVLNPTTKKIEKAKLKKVIENPASRHFARMGVITKGALIDTDKGKARVTNRPGQDGVIHAVLVE
ncbi:MAG: 30S ribosomal protein S8e [Candidatus Nanoarchaeia archaeon]|nr:30S ribosomal protein S8e [Candidatus Nanoarchaeia archaeon]MDD5239737.1 30S ribosomal protein S8e [Candidatus Nanoarchaeia archaeon]